jgi:Glycosyltransferase sugar-binding region containing DXD motif
VSIPRIVHVCFGLTGDFGGMPWGLAHYVCLASAVKHLRPERVLFHHEFEPDGPWWELAKRIVTLVRIDAPREAFGNPLLHHAHRADYLRLLALLEHGGIYLDADVLVVRPFDELLASSCVLGCEGRDPTIGLANAVILAEPGSAFLRRWLNTFRTFRSAGLDEYWNEHGVVTPAKLATAHPDECVVLGWDAFFWPMYDPSSLAVMHRSTRPLGAPRAFAHHLWESHSFVEYLAGLTPGALRRRDSNFSRLALPHLEGLPDDFGLPPRRERLRVARRRWEARAGRFMRGAEQSLRGWMSGLRLLSRRAQWDP